MRRSDASVLRGNVFNINSGPNQNSGNINYGPSFELREHGNVKNQTTPSQSFADYVFYVGTISWKGYFNFLQKLLERIKTKSELSQTKGNHLFLLVRFISAAAHVGRIGYNGKIVYNLTKLVRVTV